MSVAAAKQPVLRAFFLCFFGFSLVQGVLLYRMHATRASASEMFEKTAKRLSELEVNQVRLLELAEEGHVPTTKPAMP